MTTTWSSGICSCTEDCGSCCIVCWCPCIAYGTNAEKIESGSCLLCGFIYNFIPCCATMYQRGLIRTKYGIEGSTFNDCLCSVFCGSCTLCQMTREVQSK